MHWSMNFYIVKSVLYFVVFFFLISSPLLRADILNHLECNIQEQVNYTRMKTFDLRNIKQEAGASILSPAPYGRKKYLQGAQ